MHVFAALGEMELVGLAVADDEHLGRGGIDGNGSAADDKAVREMEAFVAGRHFDVLTESKVSCQRSTRVVTAR